jgi:hypothetical protein
VGPGDRRDTPSGTGSRVRDPWYMRPA